MKLANFRKLLAGFPLSPRHTLFLPVVLSLYFCTNDRRVRWYTSTADSFFLFLCSEHLSMEIHSDKHNWPCVLMLECIREPTRLPP